MDREWSEVAANGIIHEASKAFAAWQEAAWEQARPSVLYKPALYPDGDQWCALLGENLQEGVCGFGKTPQAAMYAFDKAFNEGKTPDAMIAIRGEHLAGEMQ